MALDIESKQTIDDAIANLKAAGEAIVSQAKDQFKEAGADLLKQASVHVSELLLSIANSAGGLEHKTADDISAMVDHVLTEIEGMGLEFYGTVNIVKVRPEDQK